MYFSAASYSSGSDTPTQQEHQQSARLLRGHIPHCLRNACSAMNSRNKDNDSNDGKVSIIEKQGSKQLPPCGSFALPKEACWKHSDRCAGTQ